MASVRKAQIVGVRPVSYTRQNGEVVKGSEIYFNYRGSSDLSGVGAGQCFVYDRDNPGLKINDKIQVYHDEYRRSFQYINTNE